MFRTFTGLTIFLQNIVKIKLSFSQPKKLADFEFIFESFFSLFKQMRKVFFKPIQNKPKIYTFPNNYHNKAFPTDGSAEAPKLRPKAPILSVVKFYDYYRTCDVTATATVMADHIYGRIFSLFPNILFWVHSRNIRK